MLWFFFFFFFFAGDVQTATALDRVAPRTIVI